MILAQLPDFISPFTEFMNPSFSNTHTHTETNIHSSDYTAANAQLTLSDAGGYQSRFQFEKEQSCYSSNFSKHFGCINGKSDSVVHNTV